MSRNRRVVIVRHGERVDHRFQDAWIENCFDNEGTYSRQNLNQPEQLPKRQGYPQTFLRDTPLTEIGSLQATLRGQGVGAASILANNVEVFTSPSLRCIQTATNVLKEWSFFVGMKRSDLSLNIEPCLFEWTQIKWYLNGNMPKWMTSEELIEAGFNVGRNYIPFISNEDLKEGEEINNYYERSHKVICHLLNYTDADILLVAHGFTLEVVSRGLLGKPSRTAEETLDVCSNIPYCGMIILEQDSITKTWGILPLPQQLQLKHESAHEFDACKTF
ncbi:Protein UBASH3A [Orchesella cincta]|uniref:Protein UBASH3A n=1 Tax=Orchesella cincta TaxID=48709 RepID=A0A1D2N528_ORCCI|nr:Protein UBASH3A [Orchesella cincta]